MYRDNLKTYVVDNSGKRYEYDQWEKEYMNYLQKLVELPTDPYNDPDNGKMHPEFYDNLCKFLNNQEKKYKFTEKYKYQISKYGLIEVKEERKEEIIFELKSDQFGFSRPCERRNHIYDVYLQSICENERENDDDKYEARKFVANCIYYTRTLGGSFLWPVIKSDKRNVPYNMMRGGSEYRGSYIEDRVDLTLWEIKHCFDSNFYSNEDYNEDILYKDYIKNGEYIIKWLKHFKDFKTYIDFFCFRDFVKDINNEYKVLNMIDRNESIIDNSYKRKKILYDNKKKVEYDIKNMLEKMKENIKKRSNKMNELSMEILQNNTYDEERALYGKKDIKVISCRFDGPKDGESALKETSNVEVENCYFNLRYPMWHVNHLKVKESELTNNCRAAFWYDDDILIDDSKLYGIKALRECKNIFLKNCDIKSSEFSWKCNELNIENAKIESEYPFFECENVNIKNMKMEAKYSFQYVNNMKIFNSKLDTKDAFWHSKNVEVYDSEINGEYLGWYSKNLKLIRCKIIGTQPLCYCKGLILEDCEMVNADLSFERSEVQATIKGKIDSIKNPISGKIKVSKIGELIFEKEYVNPEMTDIQYESVEKRIII